MELRAERSSVGLTTANARLLLAPVDGVAGRAELVSRRLGAAIRLGLLIDGERLPSESELAAQLGVSTVTLREALSVMREQGLVVTRRGRGGGTFVRSPADARAPLEQFSPHELQELGDQRAAIAGAAARLAAERALEDEIDRLEEQVDRLAVADNASDRRRADGQLMITIAAAAQSSRLTRQEARLRAEVGDLLRLEQSDSEHHTLVQGRRRLIEAIAKRQPRRAQELAESQVQAETARMIRLRLEMLPTQATDTSAPTPEQILEDIVHELEAIFREVGALAEQVGEMAGNAGRLETSDLTAVRPTIFSILESHQDLVRGSGIVPRPGLLADAEYWLEWWSTTRQGGRPEPLRVNLDPSAPDFYDYTTTDWFAMPERALEPRMSGPFVDYACTNMYACTLSVPIIASGAFAGVAAADVLVSSLERRLLSGQAGTGQRVALTTPDGRVLVSNDPGLITGQRAPLQDMATTAISARPPVGTLRLIQL